MVQINVTFIHQNKYDKFRIEYGNSAKEYVILKHTNSTDDEIWNVYTKNTVPTPGVRKESVRKIKEGSVRWRDK